MRIGLLSDTHGYLDENVFKYFGECDEIWHAGDIGKAEILTQLSDFKPIKAVFGNIDGQAIRKECSENLVFTREEMRIFITHIGGYPPLYTPRIKKLLNEIRPDIFVCGHSHILRVMSDKERELVMMNPGAAGFEGFHTVRTLLRFTLSNKKISDMQVIELGKRQRNAENT
jgi:putative phosphoesterase